MHCDTAQWFDATGHCRCGKAATGILRGTRNESLGPYCGRCASDISERLTADLIAASRESFPGCRYSSEGFKNISPNAIANRQGDLIREYTAKGGTLMATVRWHGCKKPITLPRRFVEIVSVPAVALLSVPSAAVGVDASKDVSGPQPEHPQQDPALVAGVEPALAPTVPARIFERAHEAEPIKEISVHGVRPHDRISEVAPVPELPSPVKKETAFSESATRRAPDRKLSAVVQVVSGFIPKAKTDLRDELRRVIEATAKLPHD